MAILRGPISWFGGKGRIVHKLLKYVPPHEHYVEVFGGGAALLFAKQPCHGFETYNDLDGGLVNFFRVLRDPVKYKALHTLLDLTPYSREEYKYCQEPCEDSVERARRWFVLARMSISGKIDSGWGCKVGRYSTRKANYSDSPAYAYTSAIERLPLLHNRIKGVQIERDDFRNILDRYVAPQTLVYCDPPYVTSTRSKDIYKHEMTDEDHQDLLEILIAYPQMIILSGYENEIYNKTLNQWSRIVLEGARHKSMPGAGTNPPEILWLNPLAWDTLYKNKQMSLF